jgi:cyclopropane fatty-acyl-phospholipid synthase-like methyltransferase
MKVTQNFEEIYRTEDDPWGIGRADSGRYDLYYKLVTDHARAHRAILDIGCGKGAFLSRLEDNFHDLFGVEVSREAYQRVSNNTRASNSFKAQLTNWNRPRPESASTTQSSTAM